MARRNTAETLTLAVALLLISLAGAKELLAGDATVNHRRTWPAFQGPSTAELNSEEFPLSWSPDVNVAWQSAIPGYGQSSPVVWDSVAFVTSISGAMKETCHVNALNMANGKVEWERTFASATKVESTNYVSKAAPSPVVDSQGIIVLFEVGNLVALSHQGEVRWQKNLVEEFGPLPSRHGLGSSLVQTDQLVFAWIERQADPFLLAVDKVSGKTVWKSPGLGAASWSTPALLPVDAGQHLVLSASGVLAGYDPQNGARLWYLEGLSGNTTPTPQPCGNGELLLGATQGRGEEGGAGKAAASNGVLRVRLNAEKRFDVDFKWRSQRATSSFGSPIIHRGLAYFVNATGVLFCLDADTGEEVYAERIGDSIWATPLAVGNRIYFAGRLGTTTVVEAGREFRVLAQNRLWEEQPGSSAEASKSGAKSSGEPSREKAESKQEIQYAVAAVPHHLLIRTGDKLYCIRQQPARSE